MKKIKIFTIFMFMFCIFLTPVSAESVSVEVLPPITNSKVDSSVYKYVAILNYRKNTDGSEGSYVIHSTSPLIYNSSPSSGGFKLHFSTEDGSPIYNINYYRYPGVNWYVLGGDPVVVQCDIGFGNSSIQYDKNIIFYSNYDIKNIHGDIVFQNPQTPTDPEKPANPDTSWTESLGSVFSKILIVVIGGMILLMLLWLLLRRLPRFLKNFGMR